MAKRFTDSEKWKRAWFADLPNLVKLIWLYILDDCDSNGVWHANFRRMNFDLKEEITQVAFDEWFEKKLYKLDDDKYFIPSYVEFQYGERLNETNKAHKPVIKFLEKFGLPLEAPYKPLRRTFVGPSKDLARSPKGSPGEGEEERVGVGAREEEGSEEASSFQGPITLDALIARAKERAGA